MFYNLVRYEHKKIIAIANQKKYCLSIQNLLITLAMRTC